MDLARTVRVSLNLRGFNWLCGLQKKVRTPRFDFESYGARAHKGLMGKKWKYIDRECVYCYFRNKLFNLFYDWKWESNVVGYN